MQFLYAIYDLFLKSWSCVMSCAYRAYATETIALWIARRRRRCEQSKLLLQNGPRIVIVVNNNVRFYIVLTKTIRIEHSLHISALQVHGISMS